MGGKASRDKGHRWELAVMHSLKYLFPDVKTARNESRTTDAKSIDLTDTGDLAIQCKNYRNIPDPKGIMDEMLTDKIKIIALKHNKHRGKNGEYAILKWEDFLDIIEDTTTIYEETYFGIPRSLS